MYRATDLIHSSLLLPAVIYHCSHINLHLRIFDLFSSNYRCIILLNWLGVFVLGWPWSRISSRRTRLLVCFILHNWLFQLVLDFSFIIFLFLHPSPETCDLAFSLNTDLTESWQMMLPVLVFGPHCPRVVQLACLFASAVGEQFLLFASFVGLQEFTVETPPSIRVSFGMSRALFIICSSFLGKVSWWTPWLAIFLIILFESEFLATSSFIWIFANRYLCAFCFRFYFKFCF